MPRSQTDNRIAATDSLEGVAFWPLTDGEVHSFYWFMQGSIMTVDTRHSLWRSWGFCERHAWANLAVETSFRKKLFLGPCVLYEDLLRRSLACFPRRGPLKAVRIARRLTPRGPCLFCETDAYHKGTGAASSALLEKGRRPDNLKTFALALRDYWDEQVCGRCRGVASSVRCRRHLVEDLAAGVPTDLAEHRAMLEQTYRRVAVYGRSLLWDHRGIDGPHDRASLIAAVGWFGGWRPLLELAC